MRHLIAIIIAAALAGCGVEAATTAATAALAKKQESEQGKRTMDQLRRKIGTAMDQAQKRAGRSEDAAN